MAVVTSQMSFPSVIRGHHVYKSIWTPCIDEILSCTRETSNTHDPFAVAVTKDGIVVGHVPRRISAICSLFLRRNGRITCRVTGHRKHSEDLPQKGLEVPCILIFATDSGEDPELFVKIRRLLHVTENFKIKEDEKEAVMVKSCEVVETFENDTKKRRIEILDSDDNEMSSRPSDDEVWVRLNRRMVLYMKRISGGLKLTDIIIDSAQDLLKSHLAVEINGLGSIFKPPLMSSWVNNYIQILHCRGDHWITISTIGCKNNTVHVYDSFYTDVDHDTKVNIQNIFSSDVSISSPSVQRQIGTKDCGLFAIAFATHLAFTKDHTSLTKQLFQQQDFRSHLINCFVTKSIKQFP